MSPAIALRDIVKWFGTTPALDAASLEVTAGTVHALLGENGAGKTTLMRIAFGMIQPDEGGIWLSERRVSFASPADAISAGIGMVHQHFTHVPAMTVAENVALGRTGTGTGGRSRWTLDRYDVGIASARVAEIAEQAGFRIDPGARVGDLPVGAQQRLEIVKALSRDARILILDEPTAVLAPAESEELLAWLRRFAASGRTAILITHKLREALAVADDVTVLRRGRAVLTGEAGSTPPSELAAALVGEAPISSGTPRPPPAARVGGEKAVIRAERLHVNDLDGGPRIRDATFYIRSGEIVGIAAVEGAGHSYLLRALARRVAIASGTLEVPASVAFVPEDRQRDGLILDFSLTENVALHDAGTRRGSARWPAFRATTARLMDDFDIRAGRPEVAVRTLSGGNQQKLVLARELSAAPAALVAENPTRGLDIRSTEFVRARLVAARDAGTAVVLYSSDLDEVLSLSSRMIVVHAGRVRDVPLDRETIGRAMLGLE